MSHPQTFQWNVRLSYADIARAAGADEETIRLRVRRLQEEGIIAAWEVGVHPGIWGRAFVRFDLPPVPPESREKVAGALEAMDGAWLLFEYYGGRFGLVGLQETGPALQRQVALLGAIAGGSVRARPMAVPPATVELAPADWRLVRALRRDPRAPYAALAGELGVSERTLRRRMERLLAGRALFLNPEVDFSRAKGVLPCTVGVAHREGSPRAEIDALLRGLPRIVFSYFDGTDSRVSFNAGGLPEVEDLRRRLAALAGPHAHVEVDLTLRRKTLTAWVDEQVARRAAGAPA